MTELVLGIDLGSTWCKAVYADRTGRVVAEGRAYSRVRLDLDRLWASVVQAVRAAGAGLQASGPRGGGRWRPAAAPGLAPSPGAVAVSCRGLIGLFFDRDMRLLNPDGDEPTLPAPEIDEAYAAPGWGPGGPYACGYAPQLAGRALRLRRRAPERHRSVAKLGALRDWLTWRLTGEWVTDLATGAGASEWPAACMELSDLPLAAFPRCLHADATAGALTPAAAADLGLPAGLPVATGAHDGVCANLGVGAVEVGDCCLTLGTNAVARVVTGAPVPGWFGYLVLPDRWAWVRGAPGTAVQLDAVVAAIDGGPVEVLPERHTALAEAAAGVPSGAGGLRMPYLPPSGERDETARAQGERARAALAAGYSPGAVYRAALEGIAGALHDILSRAAAAGAVPRRYVVTGGMAGNPLLARILAAVIGAPLELGDPEAGVRGATMLASVAAGWYGDAAAAVRAMESSVERR